MRRDNVRHHKYMATCETIWTGLVENYEGVDQAVK